MSLFPSKDVSVADWLVKCLFPFNAHLAGSVVPPGYEAYARILHPALSGSARVTWAEIAAWAGRVYHPAMQFESIATPVDSDATGPPPWDGQCPYRLPADRAIALADILRSFTGVADRVWYLVWEGYGGLPRRRGPRVQTPCRGYFLYRGELAVKEEDFRIGQYHDRAPEYWFPEDRSWCVGSDVDLFWTYVGGSRSCVQAILESPELESVPAELGHGLTVDSDRINRLS